MVQRWFARSVQARPDTGGLWRSGCAGAIAAWRFVEPPEKLPLTVESTPRHKAPRTFPAGHADCLCRDAGIVMQAARESKVAKKSGGSAAYGSSGGAERLVLGLALLLPLAVIVLALAQLPGTSLASPSSLIPSDTGSTIFKRPVSSNAAPPPTLAPPTATPIP